MIVKSSLHDSQPVQFIDSRSYVQGVRSQREDLQMFTGVLVPSCLVVFRRVSHDLNAGADI